VGVKKVEKVKKRGRGGLWRFESSCSHGRGGQVQKTKNGPPDEERSVLQGNTSLHKNKKKTKAPKKGEERRKNLYSTTHTHKDKTGTQPTNPCRPGGIKQVTSRSCLLSNGGTGASAALEKVHRELLKKVVGEKGSKGGEKKADLMRVKVLSKKRYVWGGVATLA